MQGILSTPEKGVALVKSRLYSTTKLYTEVMQENERVGRGIMNADWRRERADDLCTAAFRRHLSPYWSEAADRAVDLIREADATKLHDMLWPILDGQYGELMSFDPASTSSWQDATEIQADYRNDKFGLTYQVSALYGRIGRSRRGSIDVIEALTRQINLIDKMISYQDQRPPSDVIASMLRPKLTIARISSTIERIERTAGAKDDEIREFVEKMEFFERIRAYNDMAPKLWKAPWNALSTASRLRMRELYPEFYGRLRKATRLSLEDMKKRESWNADFADFEAWLSEQEDRAA